MQGMAPVTGLLHVGAYRSKYCIKDMKPRVIAKG